MATIFCVSPSPFNWDRLISIHFGVLKDRINSFYVITVTWNCFRYIVYFGVSKCGKNQHKHVEFKSYSIHGGAFATSLERKQFWTWLSYYFGPKTVAIPVSQNQKLGYDGWGRSDPYWDNITNMHEDAEKISISVDSGHFGLQMDFITPAARNWAVSPNS